MKRELELHFIQKDLMDFCKENEIEVYTTTAQVPYSYPKDRIIYLYIQDYFHPSEDSLFDFLHEIGHIMANKAYMKRCEEEYSATQWAIKKAKEYHINVSKQRIKEYQAYINSWRELCIKRKAIRVPELEDLQLKY